MTALLEQAKMQPAGKMTTVSILLREAFGDGIEIDQDGLFDLAFTLFDRSERAGLFFDGSHTWRIPTGLPFDCPFLVRPLKPHVEFDAVRYTETDRPDPPEQLTIDLREKSVCYASGETHGDELYYLCTSEQWTETADLVKSCAFDQWEEKYGKPGAGGMSWKLALLKGGSVRREITGDNDYPDAWRIFWALKQHCLRLVRREDFFTTSRTYAHSAAPPTRSGMFSDFPRRRPLIRASIFSAVVKVPHAIPSGGVPIAEQSFLKAVPI